MAHGKPAPHGEVVSFLIKDLLEPQEKAVGGVAVLPSTGLNHVANVFPVLSSNFSH